MNRDGEMEWQIEGEKEGRGRKGERTRERGIILGDKKPLSKGTVHNESES